MRECDFSQGIDASDLDEDQPIGGTWQGEPVVLVRHRGRICALAGECPHLGGPMAEGIVVDGELRCPWHHARFALVDGAAVAAPAFEALAQYAVSEEDGKVRVTGKAEAQSPAAPERDIGRVVIVGGGAAGYALADMLARHGAGGSVTVLSADADAPYDRTACSKSYLSGEDERDRVWLPAPGGNQGTAVEIRTGIRVGRIDPDEKKVETDTDEVIAYDTLVLATGAEPIAPDFSGHDYDTVHVLRTLADADRLIAAAEKASAAVILGSSYIGLEVAAALIARKLAVTVVSQAEVPLVATAGPEVGMMLRELHEEKGVTFHLGRKIVKWDGRTATLDDDRHVSGDFLVAGIGVTPRLDLAKTAGLALADEAAGSGVLVDATFQTSRPGIYAIGDIASVPDPRLGHPIRVEHWVVAQRQGQWLARHLLGLTQGSYHDLPFFWSNHYDTSVTYIGHVASAKDRVIEGDVAAQDAAVFFCEQGKRQALLTLGRDGQSLDVEAAWEKA